MRFATKVDRWLYWLLLLTAILTCVVLPGIILFVPGASPVSRVVVFLPVLAWLIVPLCAFPQYYELREDGLFLRQGLRKNLVPYPSLSEVRSVSNSLSAPVFSTERLTIDTREGRQFLIAVAEENRFLDELSRRTPQLERTAFGLALSLSARG